MHSLPNMKPKPIIIPVHIAARYGIHDAKPFVKGSGSDNTSTPPNSLRSSLPSTNEHISMYDDADDDYQQYNSEDEWGDHNPQTGSCVSTWKGLTLNTRNIHGSHTMHHRMEPEPSPYISMNHGRHSVHLTCATGASHNFITASYAWKIGLKVSFVHPSQYKHITPRNLNVTGAVSCSLYRHRKAYNFDALVVSSLQVNILAGVPFLTEYDIAIRPAKHVIIINGTETVPYGSNCVDSFEKSHSNQKPPHRNTPPPRTNPDTASICSVHDVIKKQKAAIWAVIQQDQNLQMYLQCGDNPSDNLTTYDTKDIYGVGTQPTVQQCGLAPYTQDNINIIHPASEVITCKRVVVQATSCLQ